MSDIIGAAAAPDGLIKDATIESFEADVLKASFQTPVLVDFWATWCGPCKQLTPLLEKVVKAARGAVRLVKIDIDKNQMLASQMRIQSVPTVYAFFEGRPVDGFQGALRESDLKAFVDRLIGLVGPAGADDLAEAMAAADAALEAGDAASAAAIFAELSQHEALGEAERRRAIAGLARCHLALNEVDRAAAVFDLIPPEAQSAPEFASIRARLALAREAPATGAEGAAALADRVARSPDDLGARFELAGAHLAAGRAEEALGELLEITARDRDWNEGEARKKILTVFEALGPTHPATLRGRRRLSSILFA